MPAGVILAGGRSSRMGRPKALVPVGGIPMVVRVARCLREICEQLVVVANDPAVAGGLEAVVVGDERPYEGPLGGLAAGLEAAGEELCVVVACDMPFVSSRVLRYLVSVAPSHEAVVPRSDRPQPLHAVYARSCLPAVRRALAGGQRRVTALLEGIRVRWVDREEWAPLDPEGRSWWSVDTPQDLRRAEAAYRLSRGM